MTIKPGSVLTLRPEESGPALPGGEVRIISERSILIDAKGDLWLVDPAKGAVRRVNHDAQA